HGEAAALFAGARGFDGGIERQQIGLVGDFLDDRNGRGNGFAQRLQVGDGIGRGTYGVGDVVHALNRGEYDFGTLFSFLARVGGMVADFGGTRGDVVHADRHFLDAGSHAGGGIALRHGAGRDFAG